MMKTAGLALGKYAPLHKGHQLVLDLATEQTDSQIFVIYDSPHVTDIPLRVRANWMRELYPNAQVIEAWGGPEQVGLDLDVRKAQEDFLVKTLGSLKVTHFFSSEPYGEHVANRIGATNVLVDPGRETFRVSATEIRLEPYKLKEFMSPIVYRDLITRVVFLGAPGAGKSTITEACARVFGTQFMPEYGREYWETNNVDRKLSMRQLEEIAEGHIQREDARAAESNKFLFVDTDASTTGIFADYYHGEASPLLAEKAISASRRYDITFLCMPDFDYVETPDRSGDVVRHEFHSRIVDYLKFSKRPYVELAGSLDERLTKVELTLAKVNKFQNLRDWRESA
jgi:NadR type nicotinamide-nucleotide adenylyltransferase